MILKVCRNKIKDNGKDGSTEVITEYYSGDRFMGTTSVMHNDKNEDIFLYDYDELDEINSENIHYKTNFAYLMSDKGETIERII